MSGKQPSYYETLGLSPSATPDEIKKRYRELARRYHPDVNSSPEAAQKIKTINEAYHVLGDPDRRATYDAECLLRQTTARASTPPPASGKAASPPPKAERPASSRPPFTDRRMDFNGFGRTTPDPFTASNARRATPAANTDQRTATRRASGPFGTVDRLISEAKLAYINHRHREAESLCHEALLIDRRNPVAHEILGDICVKRGQHNQAATHYSYAIQFNPRNISVQAKLDRLLGRQSDPATGPTMTRPVSTSAWERFVDGPNHERNLSALSVALAMLFVAALGLLWEHPGETTEGGLSLHLFAALAFNGVLSGILLAFYGRMRPISEELLARHIKPNSHQATVPLGTLLTLFALVNFYISLLVYGIIGYAQNRISPSILRAYGTVLLLIGLFTFLYVPGAQEYPYPNPMTALFSGNILFPTVLLGWAIGDLLRLRER
ncbi:MAG TPA: DnaJ domain-containing protein [Chthonomonadaceae bacterium]|nr:DnaJ domain-containing protein [Chthonomonadaceae bacterium]